MSSKKQSLRTRLIKEREALTPTFATIVGRMVITHVLSLLPRNAVVAGYSAIRGELDISTLMKVLAERGHLLCLPVVPKKGDAMSFRQWDASGALTHDAYGIAVPTESASVLIPDVLLVPLVAFDKTGNRLGYGAGYYDRTICELKAQSPTLQTIGIAYSQQQLDKLPTEQHDQKLDAIVTEKGVIRNA